MPGEVWAVVLAAGDGSRLRSLATDSLGVCTPKQYLSFGRAQSLLRTTLDRASALVDPSRIVTIVAASHEPWWRREMATAGLGRVLVQPRNAGTAPGLLLPLLSILLQDPDATVLVLPSDHHVTDEERFIAALRQLVAAARQDAARVMLLGMEPDGPEVQYGWIIPAARGDGLARDVDAFIEKPSAAEAAALLQRGALWSTFVMSGSATAMKGLFQRAMPELTNRFLREAAWEAQFARDAERLRALYSGLESADFSSDVLQHPDCRAALRALRAAACGWTDLGTPERVAKAFPGVAWAGAASQSIPPGSPQRAQRAISNGA